MDRDAPTRTGISIKTLAVASAASAAATLIVSAIWRPGTLAAAAAMPVIVALVSEALNRPAEKVSYAGQVVRERRTRRTSTDAGTATRPILDASAAEEVKARRKRLAVVTGLLGFLIVGVIWTVSELATGESFVGANRTTYFGGSPRDATPTPSPTPAAGEDDATPDQDGTATPTPEATPTPQPGEPTPEPTATPQATPTPTPRGGGAAAPTETPAPTPTPAP